MQTKQSSGGLPALPPSANAPAVKAAFAATAPPPDTNVAAELQQQMLVADNAETQVLNQTDQNPPPDANAQADGRTYAPATPEVIKIGQTITQVLAIEGPAKDIANLGAKQVYVFSDGVRVTFVNGKSVDVQ